MTKWDTIQADVADMYIGKMENEKYYSDMQDDADFFGHLDVDYSDDDLTLDWED